MISDCLRRIGSIDWPEVEVTPSPKPLGYRTRAEWVIDPGPPLMGYRARGSKKIVDITVCPILEEPLEATRARLRERVLADGVDHEIEIHAASAGESVALSPDVEGDSAKLLITEVNGEKYGYDSTCFFQANSAILPEFVTYVIDQATQGQEQIDGDAVDLYSGVGLFTIPLGRRFKHVTGVETHAKAGSYATRTRRWPDSRISASPGFLPTNGSGAKAIVRPRSSCSCWTRRGRAQIAT